MGKTRSLSFSKGFGRCLSRCGGHMSLLGGRGGMEECLEMPPRLLTFLEILVMTLCFWQPRSLLGEGCAVPQGGMLCRRGRVRSGAFPPAPCPDFPGSQIPPASIPLPGVCRWTGMGCGRGVGVEASPASQMEMEPICLAFSHPSSSLTALPSEVSRGPQSAEGIPSPLPELQLQPASLRRTRGRAVIAASPRVRWVLWSSLGHRVSVPPCRPLVQAIREALN